MGDLEDTRYRMQFVLGPRAPSALGQWQRRSIGADMCLVAHPDLNVAQVTAGTVSATLIGYILDPGTPTASDEEILERLVSALDRGRDLFELVYPYGGRWVLLVDDGSNVRLLNDAAGLRQVYFYCDRQNGKVWCASQPDHIAQQLGLEMDPEAVTFIEWMRECDPECWWPGVSSPYKEIQCLLPNHYLDMRLGAVRRFWPDKDKGIQLLDDRVTENIAGTLSALIESAAYRFECAQGLSAGWDSRLMLAASKPVMSRLRYYTAKTKSMPWNHPDIAVPSKLAAKLGLPHDLIEHGECVDSCLEEMLKSSVPFAHVERWKSPLCSERKYYGMRKVGVTGNVSEVARCYYQTPWPTFTSRYLATITGMEHSFAETHFESWLKDIEDNHNYDFHDLFYWEQRIGRWFSNNCLQFDCGWKDIFVPYNCRKLLVDMLSIDESFRQSASSTLYLRLLERLWPEVLSEPINPPVKVFFVKRCIRGAMRWWGSLVNSKGTLRNA